ncbi:hypothetical protein DL96DRAFT_1589580 [Flagelloscypha sp. PMI_526]|nr:hypothetical protein DL96DRAFT_1589580 [Flagelloscypha sp. PMI_526]
MEVGARELDERAGLASLGKVGNNLLNLGSLGFSLGNIGDAVSGLFSREEAELFAREVDARAGLASLGKVGNNLLNLGSLGFSLGNIGDAVSGLFSRDEDSWPVKFLKFEARAAAGGLSKILGNAASGAGLLSSGINIGNFLSGLFGGDDAAARRDLSDMEARAGLASLGKVGNNLLNLGSLGFSLGNIGDAVSGLFSREITEEYVREVIEQEIYRRAVADLD